MIRSSLLRSILPLSLVLASCALPEAPPSELEGAMEAADLDTVSLAVTCDPHIARYPVAGPHNCGYDGAWSDWRCDSSLANSDWGGAHHGVDIFGGRGTPVVSPVDGVVTRAGVPSSTSGNRVTVQDGCGWGYYHGHLDTIAVAEGTWVRAGDLIGTLGNTGTPTSPHVHFNVHRDGDYSNDIDPTPMLIGAEGTSCGPDPECAFRLDGSVCEDATHISTCRGGDYSAGDCAAFGAVCVSDDLGARCASVFCPARGHDVVCLDDHQIGTCDDGAIGVGDCAAFGAYCSDAGRDEARCISVFCIAGPSEVFAEHDVCLPDGQRAHCNADGFPVDAAVCPAGTTCTAGRCEAPGSTTPMPETPPDEAPPPPDEEPPPDASPTTPPPDDAAPPAGGPTPTSARPTHETLTGGCATSGGRADSRGPEILLLVLGMLWLRPRSKK